MERGGEVAASQLEPERDDRSSHAAPSISAALLVVSLSFFPPLLSPLIGATNKHFIPKLPHTHTHDNTSPSTRNIKVAKVQDLGLLLFQRKGKKLKQRSRWCKGHFQIFFSLEHCPSPFFNDITPPIFSQIPLPPQSTGPATLSPVMPCVCTKKNEKKQY